MDAITAGTVGTYDLAGSTPLILLDSKTFISEVCRTLSVFNSLGFYSSFQVTQLTRACRSEVYI